MRTTQQGRTNLSVNDTTYAATCLQTYRTYKKNKEGKSAQWGILISTLVVGSFLTKGSLLLYLALATATAYFYLKCSRLIRGFVLVCAALTAVSVFNVFLAG